MPTRKPLEECHVLVTPTSYGKTEPELRSELEQAVAKVTYNNTGKPLTSVQVKALLPGVDGYIAGLDVIDDDALDAADQLRVIARYGAGVDRIDVDAAEAKGIVVANTPGANTVSVAELAVGLILALARDIPFANQATKAGDWPRLRGLSLEGKTVGLLGFGAIGKQTARRLAGFDCQLIAHDPLPDQEFATAHNVQFVSFDEVAARADFLSLHLPALPQTRGLIDEAFLAKMKPGACLVNTARGELIVEADLLTALTSSHLRGAALDAFETEPPCADNPLLALPQVIVTPHTGAHTDGATSRMGWGALRACLAVLSGREPAHRVI